MARFQKVSQLPVSADAAYDWHMRAGAFARLSPPFENVRLKESDPELKEDSVAVLEISEGPIKVEWTAKHSDFMTGRSFKDVQVKGPFDKWIHTHRFEPCSEGESCTLTDDIEYRMPFFQSLNPIAIAVLENKLEKVFRYRHSTTQADMQLLSTRSEQRKKKVCVVGGSGLIGSSLVPFLLTQGHDVTVMTRTPGSAGAQVKEILWSLEEKKIPQDELEGLDVLINLSGEDITSGAWNAEKKVSIRRSRVSSTRFLVNTMKQLESPPELFINASAIGYYGSSTSHRVSEEESPGDGFLSSVCQEWEAEASKAEAVVNRSVVLRLGVVLTPRGGILSRLLPIFQTGAGGVIGDGTQYMSWISIDDVLGVIEQCFYENSIHGPLNAVAPAAVTNRQFTHSLGRVLLRPTLVPIPEAALEFAFGEMARETMLSSCHASSAKVEATRYEFRHPELEQALRHLLGAG